MLQQDVGGLDVTVDDAAGVRVVERRGDPTEDRGELPGTGPAAAQQLVERHPVDEPHRDVVQPARAVGVVHVDDGRVVEGGRAASLPVEAARRVGVAGDDGIEDLERDRAVEGELAGTKDPAETAPAEQPVHLVAAERTTGQIELVHPKYPRRPRPER